MQAKHSVLFEARHGIAILTINRPEAMNALDPDVLLALSRQLEQVRNEPDIAAAIITGAGARSFSSGADIKYLNGATAGEIHGFSRLACSVAEQIERLGKIVVAAISGHAYGNGLELALACALRVAGTSARLGYPDARHGVVAGSIGISRLARLIGRGRAIEMLLRGRIVLADEACQTGLLNGVFEDELLLEEAEAMVREILSRSPAALRYTWEACCRGLDLPPAESADLCAELLGRCAATEDFRIGTQAFVDKTRPDFVGY